MIECVVSSDLDLYLVSRARICQQLNEQLQGLQRIRGSMPGSAAAALALLPPNNQQILQNLVF